MSFWLRCGVGHEICVSKELPGGSGIGGPTSTYLVLQESKWQVKETWCEISWALITKLKVRSLLSSESHSSHLLGCSNDWGCECAPCLRTSPVLHATPHVYEHVCILLCEEGMSKLYKYLNCQRAIWSLALAGGLAIQVWWLPRHQVRSLAQSCIFKSSLVGTPSPSLWTRCSLGLWGRGVDVGTDISRVLFPLSCKCVETFPLLVCSRWMLTLCAAVELLEQCRLIFLWWWNFFFLDESLIYALVYTPPLGKQQEMVGFNQD